MPEYKLHMKQVLTANSFTECIVYCALPEKAHSHYPELGGGLFKYILLLFSPLLLTLLCVSVCCVFSLQDALRNSVLNNCSLFIPLYIVSHSSYISMMKDWMRKNVSNKFHSSYVTSIYFELPSMYLCTEYVLYFVAILYWIPLILISSVVVIIPFPLFYCPFIEGVFLLPACADAFPALPSQELLASPQSYVIIELFRVKALVLTQLFTTGWAWKIFQKLHRYKFISSIMGSSET